MLVTVGCISVYGESLCLLMPSYSLVASVNSGFKNLGLTSFKVFGDRYTSNGPAVRPMLWDRCPVCLSVTLVYCQTVRRIKIPLGMEVALDLGRM